MQTHVDFCTATIWRHLSISSQIREDLDDAAKISNLKYIKYEKQMAL